MNETQDIIKIIKDRRQYLGYTQNQLAKLCGIHETHYNRIENRATQPTLGLLTRIFYYLDLVVMPVFIEKSKKQ